MVIFWRLLLGHLLADFTFQTDFINRWKRSSLLGMTVHCATHPLCYVALTYQYLRDPWVSFGLFSLPGWACIALVFVTHFLEDQWRVFTIFKYNLPDNTLYFVWDQIIHYAIIFAVIPGALRGATTQLIPELWPVMGCLFVIVTHATTVLIYFVEKDLHDRVFPGFQEKVVTMAERLVLALCFLVPGHFWPILALGWLSLMHLARSKRLLDLSWLSFYIGGVVAVLCGIAARLAYNS
ncbi:MAG: DUF3307 domain-containing protein [Elusimicrobia bacterium]|nr:DUF3307 domain-containing protein [Elusimicrobiota bacterium]